MLRLWLIRFTPELEAAVLARNARWLLANQSEVYAVRSPRPDTRIRSLSCTPTYQYCRAYDFGHGLKCCPGAMHGTVGETAFSVSRNVAS